MSCSSRASLKWYDSSDVPPILPRIHNMPASDTSTQRTQALALLKQRGRSLQSSVWRASPATTVSRMEQAGEVMR